MTYEKYVPISRHAYTCQTLRFQTADDAEHPYTIIATVTTEDGKLDVRMHLMHGTVKGQKHSVARRTVHTMNAMYKRIEEWENDFEIKFFPYKD